MKRLQEMVTELCTTMSSNEKKVILAKYPDLKDVLRLIHSDFEQFGVTSENIIKLKKMDLTADTRQFKTLTELLTALSKREITGHDAIKAVLWFIADDPRYEQLILNAIDKNLKARIDYKMINSVFPDLIPTFDVALALDINKVPDSNRPDFARQIWFASRKLDGVRCIVIKDKGKARAYSRQGKEFYTLEKVLKDIEKIPLDDVVFDGEICLMDNGKEDFQGTMKVIKKKDYTIENPKYNVFDFLTKKEFEDKESTAILSTRQIDLVKIFASSSEQHKHLSLVEQTIVDDEAHLKRLQAEAVSNGWEGLMLRKDVRYEGKRTKNLLKVKMFTDAEYKVERIETGKMGIVENGIEIERDIMSAVIIKHKGFDVGVGSGWSQEQRQHYFAHPEEIIGKTITVKYFAESTNENGGISLRFPTVKCIHENEREV